MTEAYVPTPQTQEIPPDEQRYLTEVLTFIDRQLERLVGDNVRRMDEDRLMKAEAWDQHLETRDGAGMADNAVMQQELRQNATVFREQALDIRRLELLRRRPYFGRIDLVFGSGDPEPFYIGVRELLDSEWMRQYVIDWRSPVATLYYEAETGPVRYGSPSGPIEAEMTRRRQIVITDSRITFVLDTDEDVQDRLLQWVLSRQTGDQMREIVSTLQKEQNAIVRFDPRSSVLVQGVAGSGKTSVALHRAAYLLYRDPTLRASEILILTPNPQFAQYIADVLPDLGEDRATLISISQLTRSEIRDTDPHLAKRAYPRATAERHRAAASLELPEALDRAFGEVAGEVFRAISVETPYFTLDAAMIDQLYHDNYRALAPFRRFGAIVQHLAEAYQDRRFGRVRGDVEQALRGMYRTWSLEELAAEVTARLPDAVAALRTAPAILDDVACALIAWTKFHFFGRQDASSVRHVILDEMQDLYPFQHQMIARMFACPRTLMGDVNQAVRFALPEGYLEGLERIYGGPVQGQRQVIPLARFALNHAYRSTYPITAFARAVVGRPEIAPFRREGPPVAVTGYRDAEALAEGHRATLAQWRADGFSYVAVIAADPAEQAAAEAALGGAADVSGLNVVDLESTKGMEFEAVLIWDGSEARYGTPLDRTRLYVAATRALHALSVGYVGTPSPWLPAQ